ncbi:MAG TPA: ribonuclease HII [Candidatus Dojkabacteria bacterium]|nr:ribonuclease HII [Candidatus Dojkabacteria bacterium]
MIIPDIKLEEELWSKGMKYIAGIDEAGRGPLAGPVCAGAVIISKDNELSPLVRDSKTMSEKQREKAYDFVIHNCLAYGVCMISPKKIDELGIQDAIRMAMEKALINAENMLGRRVDYLIIDGNNVETIEGYNMEKIKNGDSYHYSISAASIIAKVTRDRYMKKISLKYPLYGFERHVGYGTKAHIEAIRKYGICPIHRRSFSPIKEMYCKK